MSTLQHFARLALALALLLLMGCGKAPGSVTSYGTEDNGELSLYRSGNRYGWGGDDNYVDNVQRVLAKRCTVCHGCNDSPCQLKLTSLEGVLRGSNTADIYGGSTSVPMRLADTRVTAADGLIDWSATGAQWRERAYYSVVDGGDRSHMYRLLQAAHDFPIPERDLAPAFEIYRDNLATRSFQCLGPDQAIGEADLMARPMPFALPQPSEAELATLQGWLTEGAPRPPREAQALLATSRNDATIAKWESFFNRSDEKGQLVARYLYEHMFSHHLHFPQMPGEFYELVRSKTAAPAPIEEYVTRCPHDHPDGAEAMAIPDGVPEQDKVVPHYRLRKYTAIVVQKSHMTWELNDNVMARWNELFFATDYQVELPDYRSSNPFHNFHQLPSKARAYFLIESSQQIIEAMVKADVCTGSSATYAIRDRFWVWFMDPEHDPSAIDPLLGQADYHHLSPDSLEREADYQQSFETKLRELHPEGLSIEAIWDGQGDNPNAWLTVLRHAKSATSHYGAVNGRPETLWLLSFSNLERLYYNLVVNFKTWGDGGHQATTWNFMSRIRAEGEDLWLSLLPENYREPLRQTWTTEFGGEGSESELYSKGRGSQINILSGDPMGALIERARQRMGEQIVGDDNLNPDPQADPRSKGGHATLPEQVETFDDFERVLQSLSGWRGRHAQVFPNATLLRVSDQAGEVRIYTLIANRGYLSHDQVMGQDRARDPDQDVLSAMRGVTASYPELFINILLGPDATSFVVAVASIETEEDWLQVMRAHSSPSQGVHIIQRRDAGFFPFLDDVHDRHVYEQPVTAGILDVSEYIWPL